jgi:DNA-binding transcriptional regulator YdaS (Cro superfamily)
MRLKEYCKKNRYHFTQLAKEIDYHPAHVAAVARGKYRASERLARAIEKFTQGQVTVFEILSEYKARKENKRFR